MRRRSASVAATIRPRDARTSASCARTSAARRSFSSTSPAVARTDSTSAGSSSSAGSWTSAATSSPCAVTSVIARSGPCGQLERPTGGVDVAAVVEAIRDLERRVAECPGEPLAQAGRSLGSQLDDEVGRLAVGAAATRRSRRRPRAGRAARRARPIVSSVGASSPVALTQTSQSTAVGNGEGGGGEQRRLRASCGPAQDEQPPHEQEQHGQGDARRPGFPARGRRRRRRSAAARRRARPASREARGRRRADRRALPRRRRRSRPARRATTDAPPGTSARLDEERHPQPLRAGSRASTSASELAHWRSAARSANAAAASRIRARRQRVRSSATSDAATRAHDEREVDGDRAFPRRRASTPSQPTARPAADDRGHEEHRVAERGSGSCEEVTTVDDITRRARRTPPPRASTSG